MKIWDEDDVLDHRERVDVLLRHRGEGAVQVCGAPHIEPQQRHVQRLGRDFHGLEGLSHSGVVRIREDRHPAQARDRILEQLEPFRRELGNEERVAGDVAAGAREARDDARSNGVADVGHDHRNRIRRGCLLRGEGARCRVRHDDIHLEPDELGGELGKTVILTFGEAKLDDDILALDVTQVAQSRPECIDAGGPCRGRGHSQKPDPRDGRGRLLGEPRSGAARSAPAVIRNRLRRA